MISRKHPNYHIFVGDDIRWAFQIVLPNNNINSNGGIPYLWKEIETKELEVYTPDFPTGVGYQNYENWSKLLSIYVEANIINCNRKIRC